MKKLLVIVFSLSVFSVFSQDTLTQSFKDSVIVEFTQIINNYRRYSKNIFTKLENNVEYNKACNRHSEYQLELGELTHKPKPGTIVIYGVNGENCAIRSITTPKQLAENLFTAWKESPGHNYNMIRCDIAFFGLGMVLDVSGYVYGKLQVGN